MPKGYRHLTYEQRCQIYTLKESGFGQEAIDLQLKVVQSKISNELRRNKYKKMVGICIKACANGVKREISVAVKMLVVD